MSQTAALYRLQQVDSQIDVTRKRLEEIDALLSENEAVQSAKNALQQAEESYRKGKTRQTDLELERTQIKNEAAATQDRLYSGKVHNPRELTDLQDKLAELTQRQEKLETTLLETMLQVENAQATIEERNALLDNLLAEQAKSNTALSGERNELSAKLDEQQGQADQIRETIEVSSLNLYDTLRKKPSGVAVTKIRGDACEACASQLISSVIQQAKRGQVVTCPTCKRILHYR